MLPPPDTSQEQFCRAPDGNIRLLAPAGCFHPGEKKVLIVVAKRFGNREAAPSPFITELGFANP